MKDAVGEAMAHGLRGGPHGNDAGDIFGARAASAFLSAANE